MIGETFSHYRILEQLGKGGMGVVYRAQDTRLERPVALKFLPVERVEDTAARSRFLQEARSASVLDHPNICTIFEVDELPDGRPFIAMAFYEGETVRQRLRRSPFSEGEAADVVRQVALGLGTAHRQGIVHRDVKPENLMITGDGVVKILDFGVAKLVDGEKLTQAGKALGTTGYMSPEALRGLVVDRRTDLWSLGVVFFEMLNGELPFKGETQSELILSILMDAPASFLEHCRPQDRRIEDAVYRALRKDPEDRFQSARELVEAFGDSVRPTANQILDLTTAAGEPLPASGGPGQSIAVLPFVDLSPGRDQEYFCHGLAEELTYCLTRVEGLKVTSRTSTARFAEKARDVREIGRLLNVDTVLEGSVRTSGNRFRITVQLVKVSDGYHLWSDRYDREMEDLFQVQDEIAAMVVEALEMTLAPQDRPKVPEDIEAYNLYLKGRYHWNKRTERELERGIEYFRQVIERDPAYARAYAGLADSYAMLGVYGARQPGEVMPKALEAAKHALAQDSELAEVYASRACVRATYSWDFAGAVEDFRRSIRRDPKYATAYQWYAMNCLIPQGYFERGLVQLQRALELDPLSLAINASVGLHYYYARDYERAEAEYLRTLEIEEGFAIAHFFLGQNRVQLERYDEARISIERAISLSGGSPEMTAGLCVATAAAGQQGRARSLLEELEEVQTRRYVSPVLLAQGHVALGDQEAALEALAKAEELRAADLIWVGVRPVFDPLRKDSRLRELARRIGLRSREVSARLLERPTLDA